jgi:glycosyltransferase involved in cell wall biosynthesis
MKYLAYIANIRLPTERAHGIQIMKTCEALSAAGVRATLIVPRRKNKIIDDPFSYYQVKPTFDIVRIPTLDLVPLGRIGFFLETLIFSELATWFIRLKLAGNRSDRVVYSRDVWPLANIMFLRWNIFWEAHSAKRTFFSHKLLKSINGLVVISRGLRDFYAEAGFDPKKIHIAHDAVDFKDFDVSISKKEARTKLGLPESGKIVMYIGLLDDWKGYKTLLNASESLREQGIQTAIIGEHKTDMDILRARYPHVHFLGYRPYTELATNQRAADILVIPNSAKNENSNLHTSPLKLFAHMASGVPIVASRIPSLCEVLDDQTAYFFQSDDSQDLARAIVYCINDPKATEKAKRAAEKVSVFSWDNRARDILEFIKKHV